MPFSTNFAPVATNELVSMRRALEGANSCDLSFVIPYDPFEPWQSFASLVSKVEIGKLRLHTPVNVEDVVLGLGVVLRISQVEANAFEP